MGKVGVEEDEGRLIALLSDEHWWVCYRAAEALSNLPWMTIERNIMLPLKIVEPYRSQFRKLRRTEFRDKANALLEQVGLK